MPRGGARVGSGRKPQDEAQNWLGGNAGKRGTGEPPKPPTLPAVLDVPEALTAKERAIWLSNAEHARLQRTLTEGTAEDFAELCRLEVERAECLAERRAEGWTTRGLMLAKEYRGLMQRVEAKRRAFKLAPMGKPIDLPKVVTDEWDEFDAPVTDPGVN